MNYSYLFNIKDIHPLTELGFVVTKMDNGYGIKFPLGHEDEFEYFVKTNLPSNSFIEYIGDEFVFIFKNKDNSITRLVYSDDTSDQILDLINRFNDNKFNSVLEYIKSNDYYLYNYFLR